MATKEKTKMTHELANRPVNSGLTAMGGDVKHGGMTGEDIEIPRALLLQGLSPLVAEDKMEVGKYVNSITKEYLGGRFLALFPFKQYVKFDEDGKLLWKSIDRTDPRVVQGLEWKKDGDGEEQPPEVTEFINVLTLWEVDGEWDISMPLILSFKKTSLRIGRQFNTLLALRGSAPEAVGIPYVISTFEKQDGQKRWHLPKIVPASKKDGKVAKEVVEAAIAMAAQFRPLISQMPADVNPTEEV